MLQYCNMRGNNFFCAHIIYSSNGMLLKVQHAILCTNKTSIEARYFNNNSS